MVLGILSHSGVCRLVLCHSGLCRILGYIVWYYVIRDYVAFWVISFGIMLHSSLCRLQTYVIRDCVVCRNVVRVNVVRPTVGVLASKYQIHLDTVDVPTLLEKSLADFAECD